MSPLLSVENLRIAFPSRQGPVEVVRGVSFSLGRERLGIVGESGSGKSQTGRALLGLTPVSGTATADRLEFDGIDLRHASTRQWRKLRGARMSMVMQDPKFSLNPVMTIGRQLTEAVKLHGGKSEAHDKSIAMLEAVQIRDPERVMAAYPHELSGGMGQRAMIAMMLVTEPDLLIADEPTSALDVTVQIEVLRILDRLVSERGMGLIFISHDLRLGVHLLRPGAGHVCRQGGRGTRCPPHGRSHPPLHQGAAQLPADNHRRQPPAAGSGA
jgi:peptide/nickel transport system ATP-binding protein